MIYWSKSEKQPSKILLHACCGVCALGAIELLRQHFTDISLFYYNPNIYPPEEYLRRLEAMEKVARIYNFSLIKGAYEAKRWLNFVKGFEDEPEGGKRCELCFRFRLEKTAGLAKEKNFPSFTTTLTISPHKNASLINEIGKEIALKYAVRFLEADFKKKEGFKKTIELAKKYNLYRQTYCGCIFSRGSVSE